MIEVGKAVDIAPDMEERKRESLMELMKDPAIKDFIRSHHLDYKDYSDYWSVLLSFNDDEQICKNCKSLNTCPKITKGMRQELVYDGEIKSALVFCDYGKEKEKESKILNHYLYNNMSPNLASLDIMKTDLFKNVNKLSSQSQHALMTVLQYLDTPKNKGIFISGDNSDTLPLMAGLMNGLAKRGHDVGMIHFPTFLIDLKASFNSFDTSGDLNQVMNVPYLMIDSIGEENITPWSRDEVLLTLLSYRSINNLPTFITSMYELNELNEIYKLRRNDKGETLRGKSVSKKIKNLCETVKIDE